MGEEGVSAVKMGVTFIFLAAVLFFVVYNVIWGKGMSNDFDDRTSRAQENSVAVYFKDTSSDNGADMPTSGAYAMYENNINEISALALVEEDRTKSQTATSYLFFVPKAPGEWVLNSSYSGRPAGGGTMLKESVRKTKYQWQFCTDKETGKAYNGGNMQNAARWLYANMSGRCNVRTAKTPDGSYCMLVSIYNEK